MRPEHNINRMARNPSTTLPGRRAPEAPPIDSPEPKKGKGGKGIGKRTKVFIAGATVLGIIALGSRPVYENIPQVQQAVHRIVPGLGNGEIPFPVNISNVESSKSPLIFDNKATRGVIEPNNIVGLPQEETDRQFPTAFEKLGDGKNTLQLQFMLDISQSIDPDAPLEYVKSFSGSSYAERIKYQNTGTYDTITFQNVPAGSVIRSPVDGYLTLSQQPPIPPNGSDNMGPLIDFVGPDGQQYRLFIAGSTKKDFQDTSGTDSTGYVFRSLVDAPIFEPGFNHAIKRTYGLAVKKGSPIAKLIQPKNNRPIQEIVLRISVAREGEIGKPTNMDKPSIPTNIELFIVDGKLITSK